MESSANNSPNHACMAAGKWALTQSAWTGGAEFRASDLAGGVGRRRFLAAVGSAVTLTLIGNPCLAEPTWPDEHTHGPFHFHADFQLAKYLPLLRSVTELQQDVPALLGLGNVSERIHVFLFRTHQGYRRYVEAYFPTAPDRPALFIKQRGPGMVFAKQSKSFAIDLRHESTHAILHSILPMVPLWLDEGLGEYFEMPREQRATQHVHLQAIQRRTRDGHFTPIQQLENIGDIAHMHGAHYRDAWSWVHFMLHGPPEAKQELAAYLRDIENHVPPGSLVRRLSRRLPDLERRYRKHFRQWPAPKRAPIWRSWRRPSWKAGSRS